MSCFFLGEWVGGLELTGLAAPISQSECPATQNKPPWEALVTFLPPGGIFQNTEHSLPLSQRAVFCWEASTSLDCEVVLPVFREEEIGAVKISHEQSDDLLISH